MVRILVVDDDKKLNQAICTYLNDCGFEAKGETDAGNAYVGWFPDDNTPMKSEHGQSLIQLKRDRRIVNKVELSRLEHSYPSDSSNLQVSEQECR